VEALILGYCVFFSFRLNGQWLEWVRQGLAEEAEEAGVEVGRRNSV
jgi:hypothetical protein